MNELEFITERLKRYETFFGDIDGINLIVSYDGVVDEIYPISGVSNKEEKIAWIVFQKD